jgi:hypothetical protein
MVEAAKRRGRPPRGLGLAKEATEEALEARETSVPREDMRPAMREESPLERARKRTAEILGHIGDMDEGTDEFYIPLEIIPDGWTYEWKRKTVLGQEDPTYAVSLARAGWQAVPMNRDRAHMAMMPANWPHNTIERKGLILMERPTEVIMQVRSIEQKAARDQVRAKEAQLSGTPDGTMTRDHPQARPKINKAWESLPIPKSEQ